jgi:hypothetical protein
MMVVLLIAGIGLVLAGLLTVGFGVQLDLSFGNTLILAGAIAACTGMILLGIWTVVRELKNIAQRLGVAGESRAATMLHSAAAGAALDDQAREDGGFLFSRDQLAAEIAGHVEPAAQSPPPRPWHEEAASRDRVRGDVPFGPEPVEAASALKPRRNLLFSSSSRKERERAQARTTEPSAADLRPASPGPAFPAAPPGSESSEVPPVTFDYAWSKSERSKGTDAPPLRSSGRAPSTFTEAGEPAADRYPPVARNEDQPPVTVIKSGVVDGMAYSLYSDGSIEAQMPEGMMRFASIDELRSHLDQRP